MTPEMIEVAARTIIIEHYAAYDIRMQEGVARIMAKAVLTAALAVMWRPIKSAPRDNTDILTCDRGGTVRIDWVLKDEKWDGEPTHWMPIPDPPKETA